MRKEGIKVKAVVLSQRELRLRALVFSLDDLCFGRKVGQKKRKTFLSEVIKICVADNEEVSRAFFQKSVDYLIADGKQIQIKRVFPHFSSSPEILGELLTKYSIYQSLFLFVLYLSDLQKNLDLTADFLELGETMGRLKTLTILDSAYKKIIEGKLLISNNLSALQGLRNIANEFSLSASFTLLPEVTVGLVKESTEYKEIVVAIKKFPVAEELQTVMSVNTERLRQLLEDISDIFLDYPAGEVRKTALQEFPELCKKYATS